MAFTNVNEILQAYDALEKAAQVRVIRSSLNASLTHMVKQLKAAAPRGKESNDSFVRLYKSIYKSTRIGKDKKSVLAVVKIRRDAWYGRLIEYGWRTGKRSKRTKIESRRIKGGLSESDYIRVGDRRTFVKSRPWFWPVVNKTQYICIDSFFNKMEQRIVKEWLK